MEFSFIAQLKAWFFPDQVSIIETLSSYVYEHQFEASAGICCPGDTIAAQCQGAAKSHVGGASVNTSGFGESKLWTLYFVFEVSKAPVGEGWRFTVGDESPFGG